MAFKTFFNLNDIYKTMFNKQITRTKYKSPEYPSNRRRLIDYIYKYG